ncbi:hypothetical protein, partial [Clostridioides difficile]|uniref:hypothetical protein n=1 Tax=Clostridioides difficile TaxID=1496 RepID=UPI001A9A979B
VTGRDRSVSIIVFFSIKPLPPRFNTCLFAGATNCLKRQFINRASLENYYNKKIRGCPKIEISLFS